jgi:hypothetical protein
VFDKNWSILRYKEHLLQGLLAVFAVVLYLPTLGADFVFDSRFFVLGNDYAHNLTNLADVFSLRVMQLDVVDNNRPLYLATVILNWALCGANPACFHFVNILFHALAVVLLFRFLRALGVLPLAGFCVAILFAVHPVNCEAVAGVTYRYDLMVTVFILSALLLAVVVNSVLNWRNFLIAAGCVVCLFSAVATKENGVAGPFILAAYWWLFRRQELRRGWVILIIVSAVVVAAFVWARFTLPPRESLFYIAKPQYPNGTFIATMLEQPRIWTFYFSQILLPLDICGFYTDFTYRKIGMVVGILVTFTIFAGQLFVGLRNRIFAFGAFFFWFALLPVSNVFPMYITLADRFLYLPLAGVAIMVSSLRIKNTQIKRIGILLLAIVVLVMSFVTLKRERVWKDSVTFWQDAVAKNPPSAGAWYGLGISMFHSGKVLESIRSCERSITLSQGKWPLPYAGRAIGLDALGRHAEAEESLLHAVALDILFASPEGLIRGFLLEKTDAEKLKVVIDRYVSRSSMK